MAKQPVDMTPVRQSPLCMRVGHRWVTLEGRPGDPPALTGNVVIRRCTLCGETETLPAGEAE